MAVDVEKLLVSVEANLRQFEKEMAKANQISVRELRAIERNAQASANRIEAAMGRVGGAVKGFFAGAVAGISAQALATAAQSAIKSIADIGDAATRLGLTTDEYQQLAFAAQLGGVETEKLAAGMKKLAINSSEAARGNGALGEILKLNNVSITDANGNLLFQTEILERVAELVRNAATEQDQAAIAQAAFGKSGVELLSFLVDGAEGVRIAMASAKEDTIQFTEEQIAAAQRFDDELDTLINTISVGLKSAFIDAAIGAEGFFSEATAGLNALGITANDVGNAILGALRSAPTIGPLYQMGEIAAMRGRAISAQQSASRTISGDGKGDLLNTAPATKMVDYAAQEAAREAERRAKQAAAEAKRLANQRAAEAKRLAEEAAREAAAKAKAINDVVTALKFEYDQMQRTDLQQAIHNELRRAGVSATSEQGRQIAALVTQNYQQAASEDFLAAAQEARLERTEELRNAQMELASMAVDAMDAIIVGGQKADEVLKNLVRTLASQSLQALFLGQGPLGTLFGTSRGGGLFGSLFGGASFSGFYANGGKIGAGQFGIVGEGGGMRHAELVSGPATVTPLRKLGGSTVNFAPTIYAPNADKAALAQVQSQLAQMKRDFSKMVTGSVNRERNLNPGFN